MFPQLGPPLGFLLSNGLFLLLFTLLTDAQFAAWGWRVPFLASALLVAVGLYVRRQVGETPAFTRLAARAGQVRVPLGRVVRHHGRDLVLGSLAMVVCYAIFYISTVFALDYGVRVAHIPRGTFLAVLCAGIVIMGVVTPASAALSDRFGCRPVLLAGSAMAALSGFAMAPLLGAGTAGSALAFVCLELGLMAIVFAPMGALLPSLFPPEVRYTGASATYNIGGILGASLAPYAAQLLLIRGGLPSVGLYVTVAAAVSFVALLLVRPGAAET
jgi:MFS family permease